MEFQMLYQELTHSTDMIRALTNGIGQKHAQVKPDADSWSILEVICHLHDEEREDFHAHLDIILHHPDGDWPPFDPQGWVTQRKYNEQDFEGMRGKFFVERQKSLEWLSGLANVDWDVTVEKEWGTIKAGDMFASWVAHDNLHIRQLVELRRGYIEQIAREYEIEYAGKW